MAVKLCPRKGAFFFIFQLTRNGFPADAVIYIPLTIFSTDSFKLATFNGLVR